MILPAGLKSFAPTGGNAAPSSVYAPSTFDVYAPAPDRSWLLNQNNNDSFIGLGALAVAGLVVYWTLKK